MIYIGGIAAENETGIPKIQNAYNKGEVIGSAIEDGLRIGGIVGYSKSIIYRVYNTGKVTANSVTIYIGGVIGKLHTDLQVSNSKYLSSTAEGGAEGKDVEGIEKVNSLTTQEIKNLLNEGVRELNEITNELIEWESVK